MRQITIELPTSILPTGSVPEELVKKALTIRFLHLDFSGFMFICHVPKSELKDLVKFLKKHYRQVPEGKVKVSHEGQGIILVSGQWWNDGRAAYSHEEDFAKLDAVYQNRTYFLRSPEIVGDCLRITLVGDAESLKVLQATFGRVGLHYRVKKLCGLERSIDSAFDQMTAQQMRVIRLAYAKGYYSIPRKTSTEKLASQLQMDKGTAGEHLRRAEKKLMDFLMTK